MVGITMIGVRVRRARIADDVDDAYRDFRRRENDVDVDVARECKSPSFAEWCRRRRRVGGRASGYG